MMQYYLLVVLAGTLISKYNKYKIEGTGVGYSNKLSYSIACQGANSTAGHKCLKTGYNRGCGLGVMCWVWQCGKLVIEQYV